jgi:hypothetical protein
MRGSKPGERRGGRQKGAKNKRTRDLEERVREVSASIEAALPGAFKGDAHALLISVYKDPNHPLPLRLDAAKAAISFEKPKLAAVEHSGDADNPVAMAIMSGVPDVADTDDDHQRPAAQSH